MKKILVVLILLLGISVLAGCHKKEDPNTIVVGASYTPHAIILEHAIPMLKAKGYTLKIVKYQDYILPNKNLTDGTLDANYFQHIPYLNEYNKEHHTDIVSVAGIHIEPIGIYSKDYQSLDDIENGATVIMSNSVSDEPRLISLLIEKNLITLKDGVTPNDVDVTHINNYLATNPKNLKFRNDVDPGLLVTTYKTEDHSIVLINTNYALDGGLNPLKDALALEDASTDNPYVNVIAVRNGEQNSPKIKALVDVLTSPEMKQFILEHFQGAVIPAQ